MLFRYLRLRRLRFLVFLLFIGYFVWLGHFHLERFWKVYLTAAKGSTKSKPVNVENKTVNAENSIKSSGHDWSHNKNNASVKTVPDIEFSKSLNASLHGESRSSVKQLSVSDSIHTKVCDEDCAKFRNLLLKWPSDKPKAAIYYLVKVNRLNQLNHSLTSLHDNFLVQFDYPVIIFHEADARDLVHWKLRDNLGIKLFFQEVLFELPTHLDASAVKFNTKCLSYVGYRHMCRFHAKQVYDEPILVGLEYVWRLDDDSSLPGTISYDLVYFMWQQQLKYGYVKIHFDSFDCTTGLWDAARHYMKLKNLQSTFFEKWIEPKIFYNNFEISDLSLWMSEEYKEFINFLDSLGGIYYYRWGDAPIKSIAVTLFVSENVTHLFSDIAYQHGNFFTNMSYSSF